MQRRRAATIVGAVAVTVLAAGLALGATFGLFGMTEPDAVGGDSERTRVAVVVPAGSVDPAGSTPPPARDD